MYRDRSPAGHVRRQPMTELNPAEEQVRQILILRAKRTDAQVPRRALITYGDLCAAADPDQAHWRGPRYRGIGSALGHVSTYEHEHGRPLLSALVVQKLTMRAGDGFARDLGRGLGFDIPPGGELGFWLEQVEKIVRYWTGPGKESAAPDPVSEARARLAAVVSELDSIRRLLDTA
jgi:hypothetical protein